MRYSHGSLRSHEENRRPKQAGDRVWMEALEGRLLLDAVADPTVLDLSVVNRLVGTVPALYRLDVTAGQKYLILDQVNSDQVHVLDAHQHEIDVIPDEDDTSRMVLAPQTSGTYYLSIQEAWNEADYDVIVRQPHDDYGDRPATAVPLIEGQVINGEIEDYPDKDLFRFNAIAGERYIFEGVPDELWLRILNARGREVVTCPDGCEPMPYTGTYYIQVDANDWGVGTYALSVRHVVDDNPGDMAGARPLNIGTPIYGSIDYYGDSDWFVFRAVAGTTYEFAVDENYFGIYDAHGREMDLVGDWTDDEKYLDRQEFVAPSSGLYYLQVTDDTGAEYSITSNVQEVKDPTAPGVALPFSFDASVGGSIDAPAKSQYFSFHAEKYGSYMMHREDDDGALIALIGPDGKTILDPDYRGHWTADEAGTYYLWARAFDPAGIVSFSFSMSQELDDYGNLAAEAAPVELGGVVHGTIQYGWDEDWFAMEVSEGEHYVFNLQGPTAMESQNTTTAEPQSATRRRRHHYEPPLISLSIVGSDGKWLGGSANYDYLQMKLEWTAPVSGTIYLSINKNQGAGGGYTLSVAKAADDPQPAKPLAVGETANGSVGARSMQRFRIEMEAGKAYLQPQYLASLSYVIVSADGNAHAPQSITIEEEDIWMVDWTGAYFIGVYNWSETASDFSMQVMEYQLPAAPIPPVVIAPLPPVVPLPVVIGTPVGTVAPPPVAEEKRTELPWELADEEDVRGFSFSAEAGKTYAFKTILGTLEDSTLTLYDSDGQTIDENDDVSEDDFSSMIEWRAETSGTYFIVVGGFGEGSFDLLAYEGKGSQRKELKLAELAVADARLMFASDTSNDNEEADNGDDSLLSDNYDELDFSDQWDWGFDI